MRWRGAISMIDIPLEREAIALFERALDLPSEERLAWIEQECGGRPDLLVRVQAMLAADTDLELATGGAVGQLDEPEPPARVGAYRLVARIGRGGMGSVHLGERDTGDFQHLVAIKLIKPGLLNPRLVERFEHERRLLATLSHPNIAQLFDGGAADDGSPYIVMEYIQGLPLLDWVAEREPSLDERLRVFGEICAGIGFAHHNLIVHRDITPSNVLVTDKGTAKIIDFGIAKPPTEDQAGDQPPMSNSLVSLSLTPGYAAPERAHSLITTTLVDIYSLGKVLDRMVEPGERDGDFAAIVAKATATDPAERYPSAEQLAADVTAWRTHHPVAAAAGGRRYVFDKFVRRNRRAVIAAAAGAVLLVGAFGVSSWSWYSAEQARVAEAERFGQVRSLARYLLFDLNDRLAQVQGNIGARFDLASKAQQYLDILAASSDPSPGLSLEIAQGLIRLAEIQGVPDKPNLAQVDEAEANLTRAQAILKDLPRSPQVAIAGANADVAQGLIMLHARARQDDALKALEGAGAKLEAVAAADRSADWHRARRNLQLAFLEHADLSETRDRIPALAAELRAAHGGWPEALTKTDLAARDEAVAAYYEALRLSFEDDENSAGLFLANERRFDALLAKNPDDAYLLYRAAWNLFDGFAAASRWGREDQSDRLIRKADALVTRLVALDPRDRAVASLSANVKEGLSQNLRDAGSFAAAIAAQREVVALRRAGLTPERESRAVGNIAFSLTILGVIGRDAGERKLACDSWIEAEKLFSEVEKKGEILGFQQSMLAGLRIKKLACANGDSLEGPVRAPEG
jgi:hypothetical protein